LANNIGARILWRCIDESSLLRWLMFEKPNISRWV